MDKIVRVLIADDHAGSRKGLRALLTTASGLEIIGEATNGQEALSLVRERQPHVVLMDARMPVMDGLAATRRVKQCCPQVKVVLLTMYNDCLADAIAAGVDTILTKGGPVDRLWEAIFSKTLTVCSCDEGGK